MDTPFMNFFAQGVAAGGVRVIRFEFPYMRERRLTRRTTPAQFGRRPAAKRGADVVDEVRRRRGANAALGDRRKIDGRAAGQLGGGRNVGRRTRLPGLSLSSPGEITARAAAVAAASQDADVDSARHARSVWRPRPSGPRWLSTAGSDRHPLAGRRESRFRSSQVIGTHDRAKLAGRRWRPSASSLQRAIAAPTENKRAGARVTCRIEARWVPCRRRASRTDRDLGAAAVRRSGGTRRNAAMLELYDQIQTAVQAIRNRWKHVASRGHHPGHRLGQPGAEHRRSGGVRLRRDSHTSLGRRRRAMQAGWSAEPCRDCT